MTRFTVQVLLLVFIFQESGENVFCGIEKHWEFNQAACSMRRWCVVIDVYVWQIWRDVIISTEGWKPCAGHVTWVSVSWRRDCGVSASNKMLFVINNQQGRHRIYDSWLSTLMRRMNCLLVVVVVVVVVVVLFLLGCCHLRWKWNWW